MNVLVVMLVMVVVSAVVEVRGLVVGVVISSLEFLGSKSALHPVFQGFWQRTGTG